MNQYDRNNIKVSHNSTSECPSGETNLGKRQRFFNLVKTTKDVYIPSLTSSISQRTSEGFRKANGEGRAPFVNFPTDMNIMFYPTYSTRVGDQYETTIRFSVCSPGNTSSRKNKILFSLFKQLVKPHSPDEFDEATFGTPVEEDTSTIGSHSTSSRRSTSASLNSSSHEFNTNNFPLNELDILRERSLRFFTRNIPNLPIIIDILSKDGFTNSMSVSKTTDERGYLFAKVRSDFIPSAIRVTIDTPVDFPKLVSEEYPCTYVKPCGFGIISDIDDTIKHTGVTGDKRSMFRNVFINDIETWLIDDVSQWYRMLEAKFDVNFFYVSNSPIQIYPILQQYISKFFPAGPLFLKQYSGNLLSSIMTSSANRKILAIRQVLNDFPEKRFILVGDSGEKDFEAYITTALQHPDQIIAIYIRCCKNSLSDMGLRETEVREELNALIKDEYLGDADLYTHRNETGNQTGNDVRDNSDILLKRVAPEIPATKPTLTPEQEQMIKNSRQPPIPPTKPELTPEQEASIRESHQSSVNNSFYTDRKPPLPPRPSKLGEIDPEIYCTPSTQNDYGTYNSFFDKKADSWRNRVINGIKELKQLEKDRCIRIMFFTEPDVPINDCLMEIQHE